MVAIMEASGTIAVKYNYDPWGKLYSHYTAGTNGASLYQYNCLRYRGYYYDTDLEMYYLQTRFYDPAIGRFINSDELLPVNQFLGYNSFAYCLNDPINGVDSSGQLNEIGAGGGPGPRTKSTGKNEFAQDFVNGGAGGLFGNASSTFGAGSSVVYQEDEQYFTYMDMLPVSSKTGVRYVATLSTVGDSSKPISFYAKGRADNWALSSAGVKINVYNFTLTLTVGVDDISISGAYRNGDVTSSISVKADILHLRLTTEAATEYKSGNLSITEYANCNINGGSLVYMYVYASTGQLLPTT